MDVARSEAADAELTRMIEHRSGKGGVDLLLVETVFDTLIARRREEMRTPWCEYHQDQAARHRAVLENLIAHYEASAAALLAED